MSETLQEKMLEVIYQALNGESVSDEHAQFSAEDAIAVVREWLEARPPLAVIAEFWRDGEFVQTNRWSDVLAAAFKDMTDE